MAVYNQTTPKPHLATTHRHPRRRIFFIRRQNNKLPTVRLGGKKPRRLSITKVLRKKIKWVKLQYTCMLRKLTKHYRNLVKDIVEASASVEALQQRVFMESTFAVPVMRASFSTFPPASASDLPKTLLF
ncbi:hypothetical protein V6N13_023744 [Hibiscus sabdariffa]|uniref:Uncharacterized protein n=1 Tax=Hibiscus sabdariffa TaxID=183260 RepID=A0ABR2PMM3_9ROSI